MQLWTEKKESDERQERGKRGKRYKSVAVYRKEMVQNVRDNEA